MASDSVLVFADGVSIQPRALLLARAELRSARALADLADALVSDEAGLDCPISGSGVLDPEEVYRDGKIAGRGYYLPIYHTGVSQSSDPPVQRYDVTLELLPGETFAGRLKVRLRGQRATSPQSPVRKQLRFAELPGGVLQGDEFAAAGITVAGAPQGAYCQEARAAAIHPAGADGYSEAILTAASPQDPRMCNTVPIEVTFAQTVRAVTLTFCGALVDYSLRAYDDRDQLLGQAECTVTALRQSHTVAWSCPENRIRKVLFGHFGASAPPLTALVAIDYERGAGESAPPGPEQTQICFSDVLRRRALTAPSLLRGDELSADGIVVAGEPQGAYCQDARAVAILPAYRYANSGAVLTSASPDNAERCNTVPIAVTFAQPVHAVTIRFCGAAVVYSLKAYDREGLLLGQADRAVEAYGPDQTVAWSCQGDRISKIVFGHFAGAAVTAILEIGYERGPSAEAPVTELLPLPHSVALSLRYLATEADAGVDPVKIWKQVAFDEVVQREHKEIEAALRLATLPEVDAIHYALSDPQARCQLVVRCEAEIAFRNANQVYVPKHVVRRPPQPHVRMALPPRRLLPRRALHLPDLRTQPVAAPRLETLLAAGHAELGPVRPSPSPGGGRPTAPAGRNFGSLPRKYFADAVGEPAFTRLRVALEQSLDFHFDPALHGYLYPPRPPASGAALVRHGVATDQTIFQDAAERRVFYFLPDEFRLARDEVRGPTYRPSLQIAFFSLVDQNDEQAAAEYAVQFTFRAVPYLKPHREADARRYIADHRLIPGDEPATLLPLVPDWCALRLVLPKEGSGGVRTVERPEAAVIFDRHVVDSLMLSSSEFAEVFQSMRIGGATLNGEVRYRLPGAAAEQAVPFSGQLAKMVGPVLDAELLAPTPSGDGSYGIRVTNAIESPWALSEAAIYLLADPAQDRWTLATLAPGTLPLRLTPGASYDCRVRIEPAPAQVFGVRLVPGRVDVELDFEALWRSVLETPGWDDIVHEVAVTIDASYFTGPHALARVTVSFDADETTIELDADARGRTVALVRPFLPYLLQQPGADTYFYRVESWRQAGDGRLVKVAETSWLRGEGPSLTLVPPSE
ncbi:hypothetical protein OV079_50510 [Nannocystis pusilla]|uniref:Uncharacterized protein n=1 Tax=Nannocystis pusilla TaxID=889268 RepID=A0A9X3J3C9_9BACT|nr:hypothetical protein [Nannocystis pusilla]MCY1013631.1 hypothetical protein [Nannocystis pusilla]